MIQNSTFEVILHFTKCTSRKPRAMDARTSNVIRNKHFKFVDEAYSNHIYPTWGQKQIKQLTSVRGKPLWELFFPLFYVIPFKRTNSPPQMHMYARLSYSQHFINSRTKQDKRFYSTKSIRTQMDTSLFPQENLTFEEARSDQVELLQSWLKKPHISKYWGDGGMTMPDFLKFTAGEPSVFKHYFGFYDHLPIVFLMTSIVEKGDSFENWREKSGTNLTLDVMIGDENFVGKGYGHLILQAFIEKKCQDAAAILIDPELGHEQAIRVYKKAGFKPQGIYVPNEGDWAGIEHLIMKKVIN